MICARCRLSSSSSIMSKFNTDEICFACSHEETLAPGYARACAAEEAACRSGNYNFPGVGLSAEDHAALAEARAYRSAADGGSCESRLGAWRCARQPGHPEAHRALANVDGKREGIAWS